MKNKKRQTPQYYFFAWIKILSNPNYYYSKNKAINP